MTHVFIIAGEIVVYVWLNLCRPRNVMGPIYLDTVHTQGVLQSNPLLSHLFACLPINLSHLCLSHLSRFHFFSISHYNSSLSLSISTILSSSQSRLPNSSFSLSSSQLCISHISCYHSFSTLSISTRSLSLLFKFVYLI
jgi:hypothetical protein